MERLLRRKVEEEHSVNLPKRSKNDEDVSTDIDRKLKPNPFLAPPVLRSLMKNIGLSSELKVLRKICQVWNEVAVEELKKRAFEGSIELINFSWHWERPFYSESKPLPIPELEAKFSQFLEDTQMNPKLFQGFHFNPEFLLVANKEKFQSFLSSYTISFLKLRPAIDLKEEDIKLINSFLDTVAPNLRALEISWSHLTEIQKTNLPKIMSSGEGRFPKLQQLFFGGSMGPASFLKDILGEELSAPNLTHLHFDEFDEIFLGFLLDLGNLSRWTKLTHLSIGGSTEGTTANSTAILIASILKLGEAGMSLKSFAMKYDLKDWANSDDEYEDDEEHDAYMEEHMNLSAHFVQISQNITRFFQTQANCLEELSLVVDIDLHITVEDEDEDSALIRLPVFTSLRRLDILFYTEYYKLKVNGGDSQQVVRYHSYAHNFPKLEELTIRGNLEDLGSWGDYKEPPLSLKRLKITDGRVKGKKKKRVTIEQERFHLSKLVGLVNTLEVGWDDGCIMTEPGELFFHREGEEIPWIESLSSLHVYKPRTTNLKLGHLKNLKEIVIKDIIVWDETFKGPRIRDLNIDYNAYLDKFKYVAELDLDCIKFQGFTMTEEIREEFVKYFPFRVEFIENEVKWNHCRTHTCCG